jgi:membrane associated rhomboid family serine protease
MITIHLHGEEIHLDPEEWRLWVEDGRIPPAALVRTDTGWVPAGELEEYRQLRLQAEAPRASATPGLRRVLFPRRGFSATELLLAVNFLVAIALIVTLGGDYLVDVRRWTADWWRRVTDDRAFWLWVPTLFIHADAGHLFRNMVSLLAGAGAVEFLCGRRWALGVYLVAGLGGAWLSYAGHGRPPLSIGASGAIFGLAGCAVAFVLRRRGSFNHRQRWKAMRVYVPLFVLLYLPSLLHADYFAHVGGLVTGLILGLVVPPHARVRELAEANEFR